MMYLKLTPRCLRNLKSLNSVNRGYFCALILKRHYCSQTQEKPSAASSVKIYTKRGDKGSTSLFTGERRPKNDLIFEVLGATDELSSTIGLACEFAADKKHKYIDQLESIQCILQDIGSIIAAPAKKVEFPDKHTQCLEQWIDDITSELSPLKNFILPSGGKASACLHLARTKCRTAERRLVSLKHHNEELNSGILQYYNRLSDYLFTVARLAAQLDEKHEKIYRSAQGVVVESKQQS